MTSGRATIRLAWFVGLTFIAMGIVEVVVRIVSQESIAMDEYAFWFLSLCGGGVLVLVGSFVVKRPAWASVTLVAIGCVAGMVATMWTLVLPVFAIALLVLTARRVRPLSSDVAA